MLTALRQLLFWTILCGLLYPLALTGLSQALFPHQANGSMLGSGRGSALVGQDFSEPRYFWGRSSATPEKPYNAASSSGSNVGPNDPKRKAALAAAATRFQGAVQAPPADLLTASGSGLDPHISPAAARFQVERVARARKLDPSHVQQLVDQFTEERTFGVLGAPRVNFVLLNQELDRLHPTK